MSNETKNSIVAVRKHDGRITDVMLSNGEEKNLFEVKEMIEKGELQGYAVGMSVNDKTYIRALPDQDIINNLSRLPKF
jgi:hypothetical protein